jgi:16S rRNA (guanine(527)-N(7))-methyltransferase RsmG
VFAEQLRERVGSIVRLSELQVAQLQRHFELLQRWNKVLNLTGLESVEEIVERHFCESLFLGGHLPGGNLSIVDVGSGAGFPGVPVAVLRPECPVTLIESHQRKSVFLREAVRELTNVRVIALRAEDVEERFDWALVRAVKFVSIQKSVSALASNVAFLGGQDPPSSRCFTWNSPLKLALGKNRYLWLGRTVSRETA